MYICIVCICIYICVCVYACDVGIPGAVGTIPAIHPRTGEHYEPLLEDTADRLNIPMPHRPDADGLGGGYVSFKKELREEFLPEIDRDGERVFFGPSTRLCLVCPFS